MVWALRLRSGSFYTLKGPNGSKPQLRTMSDPAYAGESNGGPDQIRTGDTSLFRGVLYQLSYRATVSLLL